MQVIGNIGSQPEVRRSNKTQREFDVFSFAENHMGQNYTGPEIPPTWYDVSAFVKPEERQLFVKGAFLRLTGRLSPRVWFTDEDVNKESPRVTLGLLVNRAEAMPRKSREPGEEGTAQAPAADSAPAPQRQAQRPAAPRPAAQQQPASSSTRVSAGFDDLDDDIPF